jgi:hypothetical protein
VFIIVIDMLTKIPAYVAQRLSMPPYISSALLLFGLVLGLGLLIVGVGFLCIDIDLTKHLSEEGEAENGQE